MSAGPIVVCRGSDRRKNELANKNELNHFYGYNRPFPMGRKDVCSMHALLVFIGTSECVNGLERVLPGAK